MTSKAEMANKFSDIPETLYNLQEIHDKVENFPLARDVLLPNFQIPDEFLKEKGDQKAGENAYLKYLTYKGAENRYKDITEEIKDRIDFELETIERTGYPGYFLIVQDFCKRKNS